MAAAKKPSLFQAMTGWLNMSVVGGAAAGAVALHSWPLAAVGAAAYGALVAWDVVSGRGKAPLPVDAFGDLRDYKDLAVRGIVQRMAASRLELDRVLAETPPDVKAELTLAVLSIDELVRSAAALAKRGEDIGRFLATTDPRVVQQDVEALRQRAATAQDPETRAQYESALAARREHLTVLTELQAAKERVQATLLSLSATIEALPAKVARMRALDAEAMEAMTGTMKEELERMNSEVRTFEDTLQSMAAAPAKGA